MDKCNDVLIKTGVLKQVIRDKNKSISNNILILLKEITYEEFKRLKDDGLKIGTDFFVKGLPVGFDLDGDMSEEKFKQFQKYIEKGMVKQFNKDDEENFVDINIDDRAVVSAWLECMVALYGPTPIDDDPDEQGTESPDPVITGPDPGLKHYIIEDNGVILLKVWYNPINENDPYPIVRENLYLSGATCENVFKAGDKIDTVRVIVIKRQGNDTITIVLNTDKGTINETLEVALPPQIILKHFWFDTFVQLSEHPNFIYKVPEGFKIISGGSYSSRNVVISSYPKSVSEWEVELNGVSGFNTITWLTTIYDPEDKWDVQIFKRSKSKSLEVSAGVDEDYMLTGGGIKTDTSVGELLTSQKRPTGICSNYPSDNKTWKVALNECVETSYTLEAYAIGLRAKNGTKIDYLITSNEKNDINSEAVKTDQEYSLIGGGVNLVLSDTNRAIARTYGFVPFSNDRDIEYSVTAYTNKIGKYKNMKENSIGIATSVHSTPHDRPQNEVFAIGIKSPGFSIMYRPSYVEVAGYSIE